MTVEQTLAVLLWGATCSYMTGFLIMYSLSGSVFLALQWPMILPFSLRKLKEVKSMSIDAGVGISLKRDGKRAKKLKGLIAKAGGDLESESMNIESGSDASLELMEYLVELQKEQNEKK